MNIDQLVHTANFGKLEERARAQLEIWRQAQEHNIVPCSIYEFYQARAQENIPLDFSVPAFNLRTLSYQSAQQAFLSAKKQGVGAFILEIARSEMGYTDQNPGMYMANILGAALKANWQGPLFLQGDHFQTKPQNNQIDQTDIEKIKILIKKSILAGFFNIDLDGSLLITNNRDVKSNVSTDQAHNAGYVAQLTDFIRQNQPKNITISLGAEINPIGGSQNSTPDDLDAFMNLYNAKLEENPGIAKVAIQTGTSHGGTVNPDGSIKKVAVSFATIKELSEYAREKYGLGGIAQHGASTLSQDLFSQFAQNHALEIHLSTGFQNLILDHSEFPQKLLQEMYTWVDENCQSEKKDNQNNEQFHYKLRKKALKPFKKAIWNMEEKALEPIMADMKQRFDFYFKALNVINTTEIIREFIKPVKITRTLEDFVFINSETNNDPKGLDD